jgi:HEAT repeat protein
MSTELLNGLSSDLWRLAGAGSRAAPRDRTLGQRTGEVRQLAAKVPALGPLADALSRLVNAAPSHAAGPFLDLLTRMRPVRSSFASAGVPGALEPPAPSGPWSTAIPASALPRLVRWLRRPDYWDDTKDVRFFLMRHADLRLAGLLLGLLERRSADGEFIAEQFVPPYGTALAPDLVSRLGHEDRRIRAQVLLALCGSDLQRGAEVCQARLGDPDVNVRVDALRCLRVAAPDEARRTALAWLEGRSPAPLLRAAWECLKELKRARASDLPALLRALPRGRQYGAPEVVAAVGSSAVRPLTGVLDSPDRAALLAAIDALGYLGGRAGPAVPRLIELLDERDEGTVSAVLLAFQRIGPAGRAAVPRVIELLKAHPTEEGIGYSAADALVRIGRDDPAAVAALVARLNARGWDVWYNAASRLAEVGPAAAAAVPRLIALYRNRRSHWQFRMHILDVLADIGPGAAKARPLLEKVLGDREIRLRYGAALALASIGPAGKAAVPVLIEAMRDEQEGWWWSMNGGKALVALGNVGPAAVAALPHLEEAARTEAGERRRRAAREALAKIRGDA